MSIDINLGRVTTGFSDKKNITASIICSELGETYIADELNGIEIDVIWLDEIPGVLNQNLIAHPYSRGDIECYPVDLVEITKDP